jgi:hypothetical protein
MRWTQLDPIVLKHDDLGMRGVFGFAGYTVAAEGAPPHVAPLPTIANAEPTATIASARRNGLRSEDRTRRY